jgi:NAD-dependent dihydropyrimidine dehydrogenase PreA subunit
MSTKTGENEQNVKNKRTQDFRTVRVPKILIDRIDRERYRIAASGYLKNRDAFIAIMLRQCVDCESCVKRIETEVLVQGAQDAQYMP